jgi:hypothetical protein
MVPLNENGRSEVILGDREIEATRLKAINYDESREEILDS